MLLVPYCYVNSVGVPTFGTLILHHRLVFAYCFDIGRGAIYPVPEPVQAFYRSGKAEDRLPVLDVEECTGAYLVMWDLPDNTSYPVLRFIPRVGDALPDRVRYVTVDEVVKLLEEQVEAGKAVKIIHDKPFDSLLSALDNVLRSHATAVHTYQTLTVTIDRNGRATFAPLMRLEEDPTGRSFTVYKCGPAAVVVAEVDREVRTYSMPYPPPNHLQPMQRPNKLGKTRFSVRQAYIDLRLLKPWPVRYIERVANYLIRMDEHLLAQEESHNKA